MSDENKNPLVEITDLTGLGELSKSATVLVSRVLDGVGAVGKLAISVPQAMVDSKVARIKAQTAIDIATLEGRAAFRVGREQIREQMNLEAIVAKAVRNELDKNATPEKIDEDWLCQFIDKAKRVSKEEMQGLWAKIVAGEAQVPGSFSPKTLEILSVLTKADAESFRNLCSFVVNFLLVPSAGGQVATVIKTPLVFDEAAQVYQGRGINYASLQNMVSLGLIAYQSGGVQTNLVKSGTSFLYTIRGMDFAFAAEVPPGHELQQGRITFTRYGHELFRICKPDIVSEFPSYLTGEYQKMRVNCYPIKSEGVI